jgi:hypothetical protein
MLLLFIVSQNDSTIVYDSSASFDFHFESSKKCQDNDNDWWPATMHDDDTPTPIDSNIYDRPIPGR